MPSSVLVTTTSTVLTGVVSLAESLLLFLSTTLAELLSKPSVLAALLFTITPNLTVSVAPFPAKLSKVSVYTPFPWETHRGSLVAGSNVLPTGTVSVIVGAIEIIFPMFVSFRVYTTEPVG